MWTRESLEAQIAKRARAVPGVESVYIGPADPAAIKDQRSYVAVVYGGGQWGRPTLNTQPRRYDMIVSAFVHAVDRDLMFDIADALVVSLGGLKNVTSHRERRRAGVQHLLHTASGGGRQRSLGRELGPTRPRSPATWNGWAATSSVTR